MGTAAPKKRPMRSRRSGVKKLNLVKSNLLILKKLAALLILVFLFACEAPYKIVETTTPDSTGKQIRTINKYYDNSPTVIPHTSINLTSDLWFYNRYNFYNGYSYPLVIQVPVYRQQIVTPTRPEYHYTPSPSYRSRH